MEDEGPVTIRRKNPFEEFLREHVVELPEEEKDMMQMIWNMQRKGYAEKGKDGGLH